jgi:hypothetical protein
MVKIRDVTSEKRGEKERARLEIKLAKECFPQQRVKLGTSNDILIYNWSNKTVVQKNVHHCVIYLYDLDVLPQAENFAHKYEEMFGVSNFVIETDYSK